MTSSGLCAVSHVFLVQTMLLFQNHTDHSISAAASGYKRLVVSLPSLRTERRGKHLRPESARMPLRMPVRASVWAVRVSASTVRAVCAGTFDKRQSGAVRPPGTNRCSTHRGPGNGTCRERPSRMVSGDRLAGS